MIISVFFCISSNEKYVKCLYQDVGLCQIDIKLVPMYFKTKLTFICLTKITCLMLQMSFKFDNYHCYRTKRKCLKNLRIKACLFEYVAHVLELKRCLRK